MEISIHITDSCNLNCKSCMHMIPLSSGITYFVDTYIKRNFELLSRHDKIVDILNIMGGEPTLHPQLTQILYLARNYFPNTKLVIATNGTNLNIFKNEEFIKALKETDTEISITEYPYSANAENNYSILHEILNNNNICYRCGKIEKFMVQPFHKNIINNISNYKWCKSFHYCTMLKDNKLYVCHLAAYVDLLKNRFPELDWIQLDDNAYIDLTDDNITDEIILEKMRSLSIICEHCAELNRGWTSNVQGEMVDWSKSNLKKEEWVKE